MASTTPPPPPRPLLSLDALFDNPVFAGGIGLAGLGAAAALGRRYVIQGAGLVKRRLLVDLEISKLDPSYQYVKYPTTFSIVKLISKMVPIMDLPPPPQSRIYYFKTHTSPSPLYEDPIADRPQRSYTSTLLRTTWVW
jgi:hypothetical protein